MPGVTRLAFIGDLMLGRGVSDGLKRHEPEWFWGDVLPVLRQSAGVLANLEAPITSSTERWRRSWKMFHFRADPIAIEVLRCANIRFVCLANNHAMDFGERGLLDTMGALDEAGIGHAGAGRNAIEAASARILDLDGLKLGLIAATDNMRAFAAGPDRPGTHFAAFTTRAATLDWVARSVAQLRRAGAGPIVLSLHWGPNMRRAPSRDFRRFAHGAIERGVDVIHGHSAHVVQAVERHGEGVILYDVGNFIDDYWKFPFRRTFWSFVFLLDVEAGRPRRLALVPVHIHASSLGLAQGKTFRAITDHMRSLCRAIGTDVATTPEGLEIPLG